MDQDSIVDALTSNLNGLSVLTTSLFALSALTLWSTLRPTRTFQLLSFEVSLKHAYVFFGFIFATLISGIAIYLYRLDRMMALLDIEYTPAAVSAVMLNESITNPYAFFAESSLLSSIADATGPVAISLTMWCGIVTLNLIRLRSGSRKFWERMLGNVCIAISGVALAAMYLSVGTFLDVTSKWSPALALDMISSMRIRNWLTLAPAIAGLVLIFCLGPVVSWLSDEQQKPQ